MLVQWTDWWFSEKGGTRVRQGVSEGLPQREVALDKQSGREMHSRRGAGIHCGTKGRRARFY